MIKYGLSLKGNIVCMILILGVGVGVEILSRGDNFLGAFYLMLTGLFPVQLITSVGLSTMVQTSKYKKKLQTLIPVMTGTVCWLIMYTIVVAIRMFFLYQNPEDSIELLGGLIMIAAGVFLVMIFAGFSFKHFVISILFLVVTLVPVAGFYEFLTVVLEYAALNFPVWPAVLGGYVLILLGGVLEYLITLGTYKTELSRYAFGSALKKASR